MNVWAFAVVRTRPPAFLPHRLLRRPRRRPHHRLLLRRRHPRHLRRPLRPPRRRHHPRRHRHRLCRHLHPHHRHHLRRRRHRLPRHLHRLLLLHRRCHRLFPISKRPRGVARSSGGPSMRRMEYVAVQARAWAVVCTTRRGPRRRPVAVSMALVFVRDQSYQSIIAAAVVMMPSMSGSGSSASIRIRSSTTSL